MKRLVDWLSGGPILIVNCNWRDRAGASERCMGTKREWADAEQDAGYANIDVKRHTTDLCVV